MDKIVCYLMTQFESDFQRYYLQSFNENSSKPKICNLAQRNSWLSNALEKSKDSCTCCTV